MPESAADIQRLAPPLNGSLVQWMTTLGPELYAEAAAINPALHPMDIFAYWHFEKHRVGPYGWGPTEINAFIAENPQITPEALFGVPEPSPLPEPEFIEPEYVEPEFIEPVPIVPAIVAPPLPPPLEPEFVEPTAIVSTRTRESSTDIDRLAPPKNGSLVQWMTTLGPELYAEAAAINPSLHPMDIFAYWHFEKHRVGPYGWGPAQIREFIVANPQITPEGIFGAPVPIVPAIVAPPPVTTAPVLPGLPTPTAPPVDPKTEKLAPFFNEDLREWMTRLGPTLYAEAAEVNPILPPSEIWAYWHFEKHRLGPLGMGPAEMTTFTAQNINVTPASVFGADIIEAESTAAETGSETATEAAAMAVEAAEAGDVAASQDAAQEARTAAANASTSAATAVAAAQVSGDPVLAERASAAVEAAEEADAQAASAAAVSGLPDEGLPWYIIGGGIAAGLYLFSRMKKR